MARDYMFAYRLEKGISLDKMAAKLKISPFLLALLEEDETSVTHPEIVKSVAKAYKLTKEQRTMMLPPNYRPGPDYDPNRYKLDIDGRDILRRFDFNRKGVVYRW